MILHSSCSSPKFNSCFSPMDAVALATIPTTAANNPSSIRFFTPSYAPETRRRRIINLSFPSKPSRFMVFASKNNPTEHGFGHLAGEDSKLSHAKSDIRSAEKRSAATAPLKTTFVDSSIKFSMEAVQQGKPKRVDQFIKGTSNLRRVETSFVDPESYGNAFELENFLAASPLMENEDNDWETVEDLFRTGDRGKVELISSSTRGFVVSFGSLIGFLPYRYLAARWKFLAFESWLRRKGLDPFTHKHNTGVKGNSGFHKILGPDIVREVDMDISPDMKVGDLLSIYDQEKLKFLSSFVGQKIKLNVLMADRRSRRLIFSMMPKEKEEMIEKKRCLMAKLSIGDVVKCCIKKITYFGIFVEVQGVPALIHLTEVSWDATLDSASYFKLGQVLDAKVHQLDFSLERIFLSLKENMVYVASMCENKYKLLAQSGNNVQEVMVQTFMGKEEAKSAILSCTNWAE
ncbi:uncharacterized protein LOC130765704 isoform X2 [Actinidia eriantha]|uniref:uncharacterized protein LOC130765704 isoform X2 n=1 Tax=Actinidia eriantha TaxID=165200 RepID=UPI00258303E8|nr:uncharacterized protein LOC130765704 isoform X2 [Actinidia eriantha]